MCEISEVVEDLKRSAIYCKELYLENIGNLLIKAADIIDNLSAALNVKWIPVTEKLPQMPKKNPVFEYRPLEVYLVCVKNSDYPFRAFWNGKIFTDGFSKIDPIAWCPLLDVYKPDGE